MVEEREKSIEIPIERLNAQTLRGIIEDFVLREGTEYGLREYTLEEKVQQVRLKLERKEAQVVFEMDSGTCNILLAKRK